MKTLIGLALNVAAVTLFAMAMAGCGDNPPPRPCAPNDRSCLPCTNPLSTDPSCPPWPSDAKKPKEKTR